MKGTAHQGGLSEPAGGLQGPEAPHWKHEHQQGTSQRTQVSHLAPGT